ncbi:hypothetical protein D9615_008521 [Tricholomella constricta]|uniref:Protein SQS1 n=1 Tax=Tricholomella constricta TaxID=117010 RepID=A0A8H5H3H9_9AGAR|nr:hypothetical protein D9615_008521 [Tricholomella constricta]
MTPVRRALPIFCLLTHPQPCPEAQISVVEDFVEVLMEVLDEGEDHIVDEDEAGAAGSFWWPIAMFTTLERHHLVEEAEASPSCQIQASVHLKVEVEVEVDTTIISLRVEGDEEGLATTLRGVEVKHAERPLLRPVVFVPSVYSRTLFQEEEEIFKAVVEEVGEEEQSQVPTADRVFRVFSGGNFPPVSILDDDDDEQAIEEIDFNDMGKLLEVPARPIMADVEVVEEKFSGIFLGSAPAPSSASSAMIIDDEPIANSGHAISEPASTGPLQPGIDAELVRADNLAPDSVHVEASHEDISTPIDVDASGVSHEGAVPQEEVSSSIPPSAMVLDEAVPIEAPSPQSGAPIEQFTGFYIDTEPSPVESPHEGNAAAVILEDDDEIIVYVAPHPRTSKVTPEPSVSTSTPSLSSTSILTGTTALPPSRSNDSSSPTSTTPAPAFESVTFSFSPTPKKARVFTTRSKTKGALKQRRQEIHAARRRMERQALFGSFGAIMSEAQLRGGRERDPRWDERRRGDSDVDWGDSDEDSGDGLAEGMELDPDLDEGDKEAMRRFVKSMGQEGSRFVTMDDIADGELLRMEDEHEEGRDVGSSGDDEEDENTDDGADVNLVVHAEEEILMAEPRDLNLDDESDEDDSDDEGTSPRANFHARLERLRNRTHAKGKRPQTVPKQDTLDESDSDEDDEEDEVHFGRWAEDEDFIEEIEMILEENEDILTGRDRKARNKLFRAVRNGAFEDLEDFTPARKSKDKYKDLPLELRDQWQKDRDRKAEHKRARALARLELAADPMSHHKGGKKGRKAMLAAAKLDPTIKVIPNRVIDITTLVQQIRRFLADVGGPRSMSLPPADKGTRKNIHELGLAFNLKSDSKGKGDARYTTLTKTSMSGINVNEKKVARIVRQAGGGGGRGGEFMGSNGRGGRGGNSSMPRHKEGDEVGKAAPKIGDTNIGFRMLALMGWSEGQRIGVTGGLDAPLTAVIKNTKLGLGATR